MHTPPSSLYIGLMSGTSLDGVDGVLCKIDEHGTQPLGHRWSRFDVDLAAELLALNTRGDDELHRCALAANRLMQLYAAVVQGLLEDLQLRPEQVRAIGAHGQTVRHRPGEFDGIGYTAQLNAPALLAELSGIDVIADFRSRDVAAGGQGAPLVPAFHAAQFGQSQQTVAVLNIGGISNLTIIPPQTDSIASPAADPGPSPWGFDCGPGNVLMDLWCSRHFGRPFDTGGAHAAQGRVLEPLLEQCLAEPYFRIPPPKSTGRDLFHAEWLASRLAHLPGASATDVQATLCELTAQVCAQALRSHAPQAAELIVCGGGSMNANLMQRLATALPEINVVPSDQRGLAAMQVEAAAFAWLAWAHLARHPANLPKATGARGLRVLGACYPS